MEVYTLWSRDCEAFAKYGILAPPRVRLPPWVEISAGGVPVPPVPGGEELAAAIAERRRRLPEQKRTMARYAPDSAYWKRRFRRERTAAINMFVAEREQIPMHRRNAAARGAFWSVPGRTIRSVIDDARREDFLREADAAGIIDVDSDGDDEDDDVPEEGGAEQGGDEAEADGHAEDSGSDGSAVVD